VLRYFVIVGRAEPDLGAYLRRQFAGDDRVRVLVDRRRAQRRQRPDDREPERRRAQRRAAHPAPSAFQNVTVVRHDEASGAREAGPLLHRPVPAANGSHKGASMTEMATAQSRRQVTRWIEESRHLFGQLPAVLDDLLAAEAECARLRERVDECRAENERLRAERAELAEALSALVHQMTRPVNEIVQKLRAVQERG
jgi:hypothetical protein